MSSSFSFALGTSEVVSAETLWEGVWCCMGTVVEWVG